MSKNLTIVLAVMGVVIIGGVGYLIFGGHNKSTNKDQSIVQVVPSDNGNAATNTPTPPPPAPTPAPVTPPAPPAPEVTKTPEPTPAPVASGTTPSKIDIARFFQSGEVKPATSDTTPAPTVADNTGISPFASVADPSTRPSVQSHVVAAGESFSSIAAQVYGSSKYVGKLMAANPNIDPLRLRVGMKIVVPELSSSTGATRADATTPTAPAAPTATVDMANGYKVQPGDTLEGIAVKLYGQSSAKFDIYTANKALIGPNPDRLKVGWVLKLPAAPSTRPSN